MANTPLISERRTAVRMLQTPWLEVESTGASASQSASACGSPRTSQQFATPNPSSIRQRSVCFPPSPTTDDSGIASEPARRAVSTTAPASPALPRRLTLNDMYTPDGGPQPSPRSLTIPLDPGSPNHLSVPLALLSLHNGGGIRHSPRSTRASSCAGLPSFKDGTSICSTSAETNTIGDDMDYSENNTKLSPERTNSTSGSIGPLTLSPPRHSISMLPTSSVTPVVAVTPPLVPAPATPAITSVRAPSTRVARTSCPSGGAAGSATANSPTSTASCTSTTPFLSTSGTVNSPRASTARAFSGGIPSASTASLGTTLPPATAVTEGGEGAGGGVAITMPIHLSTFRPPTPMCREDDVLASAHVMNSPTRRRSRFATAAECNQMAATAAGVVAEEAWLLDSPIYVDGLTLVPPASSAALGAGVGGPGMGSGTGVSLQAARSRRSLVPMAPLSDLGGGSSAGGISGSVSGPGVSTGGSGSGACGEQAALEAQSGGVRVVGGPGGGLDASGMRSGGSMVWRTAPQLGTVLEEPSVALATCSSSSLKCGGGAPIPRTPMSPYTSPAGSRRPRGNNNTSSRISPDDLVQPILPETPNSMAVGISNSDPHLPGNKVTQAAPQEDSLSSFMHSFGPPGTPGDD